MLNRSVTRELPNGECVRFPCFSDLAEYLVSRGAIESRAGLATRHDLLADVFFTWVRSGQLACEFAQSLAADRDRIRWQSVVVSPPYADRVLAALPFATHQEDRAEATAVVFPEADTPDEVVELLNRLCAHSGWFWEPLVWKDCEAEDRFRLGLRWSLPDEDYESLALGFAPFETMPFTRRLHGAPMSVVTLRTKTPPPEIHPLFAPDGDSLHLAHLEPMIRRRDQVEGMNRRTEEKREQFLRGPCEDEAAKAKVTFCLPVRVRDQLRDEGRAP